MDYLEAGSSLHYLVGRPDGRTQESVRKTLGIFRKLGLPVAPEKLEGLTTSLIFLGFELNTLVMEVCLLKRDDVPLAK